MKMISRQLLIALAVTLGLTVWVLVQPRDEAVTAVNRAVAPKAQALPQTGHARQASSGRQADRLLMPLDRSPFGMQVAEPPAPPPPVLPSSEVVVPMPAPEPPPIPFRYIGRLVEDGRHLYFVADSNRVYPTEPGSKITPDYELTHASETELVLTYLPLAQTQVLRIEN